VQIVITEEDLTQVYIVVDYVGFRIIGVYRDYDAAKIGCNDYDLRTKKFAQIITMELL